MKVTMLLADAAQAVEGKLYILGGGWSITGPAPTPSAVAIKIEVPWDQANERHRIQLNLLDTDGKPITAPNPAGGMSPVEADFNFEVGRPAGLKPGTPIDFAVAINVAPLTLTPDSRFVWRLSIDGHHDQAWELEFTTRPAQPGPPAPTA